MIANHVTNNHLKKIVKDVANFINNGSEVPEDLLFELINEIRVSNLIIPANIEGEFMNFKNLELDDGSEVIGLFTDMDEFLKFNRDYNPISNQFPFYKDLVESHHFNGIIINPQSDDFFIDLKLLSKITIISNTKYNEGFNAEKLKEIAESISNDDLVKFIRKKSNLRNYDELVGKIEKSTLLNVVTINKSLVGYTENGIINSKDIGGFNLSVIKNRFEKFVALFTNKQAITDTCDMSECEYYCQVCDLVRVLEFVLYNDMDGAILNPGLDDYFIPRNVLLRILNNEKVDNRDFKNAVDYAFIL